MGGLERGMELLEGEEEAGDEEEGEEEGVFRILSSAVSLATVRKEKQPYREQVETTVELLHLLPFAFLIKKNASRLNI